MARHTPLAPQAQETQAREQQQAARTARQGYPLRQFIEDAWSYIEPQPFIEGWHIDALCAHLQAVTETAAATDLCPREGPEIRNLLVNVPPRTSKSLITSVLWSPWVWLTWPACRFLYVSYAIDLSLRDATYSRILMQTAWYESLKRSPWRWQFTTDQNVKSFYANSAMGYRMSTAVNAKATGFGADLRVADDLHATQEDFSVSRAEIATAKQFWQVTMATRTTDAKRACQVVIGQRVAADDVSGAVLKAGGYAYLKIPMEYEPDHVAPPTPLGWVDPRTEAGELLCPARFGPVEVAALKTALGHRYYAQCQQRPVTEYTSLYPRGKWKFFHTWPPVEWFDVIIQSWDYRFGDKKQSGSYVAGHLWGRRGTPEHGEVFLLDRVFARMSFLESLEATTALAEKWPGAYAKLIEQAANGEAIYATLRSKVFGLVLVPVGGRYSSKEARAEAVTYLHAAGRAWVPHPQLASWVDAYMDNMENFPGEPQDDTDATSQAWHYLCRPVPIKDRVIEEREQRQTLEQQIVLARARNGHGVSRSRTRV